MTIKLKALQTFDGVEGFVRMGNVFEVASEERAEKLKKLNFAEDVDQDAATDQEKKLDDYKVDELKAKAKDLQIDGYSTMLKDDLVEAISKLAYTNGEAPQDETAGETPNTPARLQTLESGNESDQPKAATKKAAPVEEQKAESKDK